MSDEPLRFKGMIMAWKEEILHCYFVDCRKITCSLLAGFMKRVAGLR